MRKKIFFITVLILIMLAWTSCANNSQNSPSASIDMSNDQALKKISSTLLGLVDQKYLPQGVTKEQLLKQMQDNGEISDFKKEDANITGVYVYIKVTDGAEFADLKKHVINTEAMDKDQKIAVCWVDINKLKEIAELDYITGISEVTPPEASG